MLQRGSDILEAIKALTLNQVIAIPTETVYGLAANGLAPEAVAKLFEIKRRPASQPITLLIANGSGMDRYARDIPDVARALSEAFWPGPLTLVLPRKDIVPDIITAGGETVGLRVPDHPLTLELLENLDFPLAAPSANIHGKESPTLPEQVAEQLGNYISYLLDGGPCTIGIESSVVEVNQEGTVNILRQGGISSEQIEDVLGPDLSGS